MSQRPPARPCPSCDEPVIWCKTVYGNRMPVDAEPTETGTVVLSGHRPTPVAVVVSRTGREPGTKLYVSHHATCRNADKHRKAAAPKTPAMPQEGLFSEVPR